MYKTLLLSLTLHSQSKPSAIQSGAHSSAASRIAATRRRTRSTRLYLQRNQNLRKGNPTALGLIVFGRTRELCFSSIRSHYASELNSRSLARPTSPSAATAACWRFPQRRCPLALHCSILMLAYLQRQPTSSRPRTPSSSNILAYYQGVSMNNLFEISIP
jgi:hypothetical protein